MKETGNRCEPQGKDLAAVPNYFRESPNTTRGELDEVTRNRTEAVQDQAVGATAGSELEHRMNVLRGCRANAARPAREDAEKHSSDEDQDIYRPKLKDG